MRYLLWLKQRAGPKSVTEQQRRKRANRAKRGTRKGFTTGACAAAAARAAMLGLVEGAVPEEIESLLPNGQRVLFKIIESELKGAMAWAAVKKDAGDDPDVTNGAHITASVKGLDNLANEVKLCGGEGVGVITMPGLGLEINSPAINPVPRRNIEENLREVGADLIAAQGVEVTISVPGGEKISKRTLNARLGIIGGISILGTTGIVHPWSTAAFRASVVQGVEVATRQKVPAIVLTTGGRTEKFMMGQLPDLPQASFVQMGDFLKPALDAVVSNGIKKVLIGGMAGKLTKMAQGETITHAGRNPVNTGFVADIAAEVGAPIDICDTIRNGQTARYAAELLGELGLAEAFYQKLAQRVIGTLSDSYPGLFELQVLVCDFEGNYITEMPQNG